MRDIGSETVLTLETRKNVGVSVLERGKNVYHDKHVTENQTKRKFRGLHHANRPFYRPISHISPR